MMDYKRSGWVSTRFVLKKLDGFKSQPSVIAETTELLDEGKGEMMDYPHFCKLILELAIATSGDVRDPLNTLTVAVVRQDGAGIGIRELVDDIGDFAVVLFSGTHLSPGREILESGKIRRLFDPLDVDHDGLIIHRHVHSKVSADGRI